MTLENIELHLRYGLRPAKPQLVLRTLKSYAQARVLKTPPLKYIDFATDYACNLSCEHCFATALTKQKGARQMEVADYKKVAKEAIKMGVLHFSFQGGEPLLDKRLPEIIQAFKPSCSYISITTNGMLLTKKRILALKKIGVDKINISLDSFFAQEHDRFRKQKGVFKKAWQGMEMALKMGLKVTINTCISHENIRSQGIKKLVEYAIKNKIILNPIFAVPAGRWQDNLGIVLTEEDKKIVRGWEKRSPYIRRDLSSNYFVRGCPAVKEVLYITPYGEVMPCPFLHILLGNVLDEPLLKIRNRALKYKIFSKYHSICLAAEDKKFMKNYLSTIVGKKLPIDVQEVLGV